MSATPLVSATGLGKRFATKKNWRGKTLAHVDAVKDVDISILPGETLGLVGESGSGKSTLGRLLLRLIDPTDGRISFSGQEITHFSTREMRPLRKRMQIIFQDPYTSLNPRMTVEHTLREAIMLRARATGKAKPSSSDAEREALMLLARVGLRGDALRRYPGEFSGGQRQRIGIARALAMKPEFIVADEPVSALDVSVQAQIINLLLDLQDELTLSFLFISHDLHIVKHISHRVAVMYLGHIVELAETEELFSSPAHPYTQLLLNSAPKLPREAARIVEDTIELNLIGELEEESSSATVALRDRSRCVFAPSCARYAPESCNKTQPRLVELKPKHYVACYRAKI